MCAVYLSPGVYSREKDLSTIVPNVATSSAALVGSSAKGSLDVKLITNSQQFIQEYGEPTPGEYFHYTALAFLENGNTLYCKRVVNGALYGGMDIVHSDPGSGDNAAFGAGQSALEFYLDSGEEDVIFSIFAQDPGVWNNKTKIIIKDVNDTHYDCDGVHAAETVDQYTFTIEVWYSDDDGNYSLVESWKVSRKTKTDGYGIQLYLEDKINGFSNYIYVIDNPYVDDDTLLPKANVDSDDGSYTGLDYNGDEETYYYLMCDGGSDGLDVTSSNVVTGWNDFTNPDDIDVRILLCGGQSSTSVCSKMKVIAEARQDCIAVFDIPYSALSSVQAMIDWRRDTLNLNSNYCAFYSPWVKINDSYNGKILLIPSSGYVGSQYAYSDYREDAWWAPAGFNRGILNVLGLSHIFTEGERDRLYSYQINPLQTFRGQGNVIWGQKTLQVKPSALDRVNVRRLLIVMEKSLTIGLHNFLFEPNSELTRFKVTAVITEYMDMLSGKGAFQTEAGDKGFLVVCDTRNNTPAVIDRNELYVDVFVKPIRAAEFIRLQTIITTTGVSFNELIAKGVLL